MKKQLLALLMTGAAVTSLQAEELPGQALVDQNCQRCHDNSIYTRSNSIIQSYPELQARVEFCENAANTHWSDQQINQVIDYLNQTFYRFKQ